jgi:hypothetical protein
LTRACPAEGGAVHFHDFQAVDPAALGNDNAFFHSAFPEQIGASTVPSPYGATWWMVSKPAGQGGLPMLIRAPVSKQRQGA